METPMSLGIGIKVGERGKLFTRSHKA